MKRQPWCMVILALLGLGSINEHVGLYSTAMAQTFGSRWGFGFGLGANQLYSDLAITGNGFGVDGHIERRLGSRTGLRFNGGYGELPFTTSQNVPLGVTLLQRDAFKTNIIRGDLRFDFDLTSGSTFRPYLAFGVGGVNFQVTGKDTSGAIFKSKRFNDGLVLAGGGMRFMLGPRVALNIDGNFNYTFGDDLDATSILGLSNDQKRNDGFFSVMAGFTFFGAGGRGTDIYYTDQAPVEEVDSQNAFNLEDRINELETSQQQPQDMQEYIRLKSQMDDLNQQIEQKEDEINVLRTAVVDKKENVSTMENKLAATPSTGTSVSFSRSYEEALSKFYAKRYQEAIDQFAVLVSQFPDHSLSSNCVYWIGESHFGAGNYRDSITAFNRVFNYSKSLKKDDALLMLGRAHMKLNQKEEARQNFTRLIQEHPNSEFVGKAEEWLNKI